MNNTFNIANPGNGKLPVRSTNIADQLHNMIRKNGGLGELSMIKILANRRAANRPGATTPPAAPPPSQWTFQPNPMDQPPAGQPPAPGNAGQAQGQNPWAYSPPIQPWMFNPMGGGWGQGGGWQDPGFPQQPPGMPPQTGGGLPPYQPQLGGQLPPYSGNISNTVPTMQPSSPYSGQPWQQIKPY